MHGIKKGTKVKLVAKGGREEDFTVEEAETLLNNPKNVGHWFLPDKSKYKLQDGKIISTANPGTTQSA